MKTRQPLARRIAQSPAMRPVILLVIVLALWEIATRLFKVPTYLVPSPGQVIEQLIKHWPKLLSESGVTTVAALGGFVLSVVIGVPMALLIAYSKTIENYLYPLLVFSQSVPKIAVAPLFVVWFGFGILPKVISAFLLGFFPVVVAMVTGFKSVEPDMLDLARSVKAGRLKTFWFIALPYSMPYLFAGLKVCITLVVVGAVVGEFVGSNSGIGYVLQVANGNFDLPLMFAALLVLSTIGVILFAIVDVAEHYLIPWHSSRRTSFQATA
ncbi:ABC transporter permease [Variovorax sp. VNK109]|jgi:NitT/TauT family transport system permease protein|uniref:ABC transporter permease n=1 Tax=Variovorax sp. VNK109 TaxID=3400919 RepID=UPI003BFC1583